VFVIRLNYEENETGVRFPNRWNFRPDDLCSDRLHMGDMAVLGNPGSGHINKVA